jgi:uncharacterized protein
MLSFLTALALFIVLLACWCLTLLGMPGNWLMVVATAIYAWLAPAHATASLGWRTVAVLLVIAALGEVVELLAGAAGAARAGGSKRGAAMALLGSGVGGILGLFFGLPVPLVGSMLAALLFAALGAMAGAVLGEICCGRSLTASWQIGKLAFWGRLSGTVGKLVLGAVMIVVVAAAMLL